MAFIATVDCFDLEELATKVIPCVSSALIDKEKWVLILWFKEVAQSWVDWSESRNSRPSNYLSRSSRHMLRLWCVLFFNPFGGHCLIVSKPDKVLDVNGQPNSTLPIVTSQNALVNSAAGAAGAGPCLL